MRDSGKEHRVAFHTGLDPKARGEVGLPGSGVPVYDDVASIPDEGEGFELGQEVPSLRRKIIPDKFLQVPQLREAGLADTKVLAVLSPLFEFPIQPLGQELPILL